ncbi:hypothetical protein [Microbacterium oleivorans]|uniref:hypothetical protein n=1 Tax=Microbacterium oleivorans TaxID=273677 RepID=UPI001146A598|nr:hypothetical protein [Microbacterium oleivorans]
MARQDLSKLTRKAPAAGTPTPSADENQLAQDNPAPAPAPAVTSRTEAKTPAARKSDPPSAIAEPIAEPTGAEDSRETASKGVPVHLPTSLNERLQAYMSKTRKSHQTVLLDALEATYHQLPDLVEKAISGEAAEEPQERASLFARPSRPAPMSSGEPRVKHTVRVSPTNRKILDQITAEVQAPSRNLLIITAYEAFLPSINES